MIVFISSRAYSSLNVIIEFSKKRVVGYRAEGLRATGIAVRMGYGDEETSNGGHPVERL